MKGHLIAPARRGSQGVRLLVATEAGRLALHAAFAPESLGVGDELRARGRVVETPPWLASFYARHGVATVVEGGWVRPTGARRGGIAGRVDAIRRRAEDALGRGMAEREAALARGFVLGQDDAIDPRTAEAFRRSGLAHLLAVSGQNVLLLMLLAWPFLALVGLTLRARAVVLVGLIALYVPLAGAGPSIQRAGVMGAVGMVALLAGRPSSRWYALAVAAALTLAWNPRSAGDVGWQLSFAAVVGLIVFAPPLASALAGGAPRASPRRALADGAAATISATVVTAPLMALHFDAVPVAAVPANLLALPAVAPAMWLGMLAAAAGQIAWLPVEPLNWLNSLCLAHIGQVADWLGSPDWALAEIALPGPAGLALAYAVLAAPALTLRALARRRGLRPRNSGVRSPQQTSQQRGQVSATDLAAPSARARLLVPLAILAALGALLLIGPSGEGSRGAGRPADAFTARFLDVGQGDAILLDPPAADPVLVDTGPPGAGIAEMLRDAGVDRLAALLITHDQADHAGGAWEVLESVPVGRLCLGAPSPRLRGTARAAGVPVTTLAEGSAIRSGALELQALWPPRELLGAEVLDPNRVSLVMVARWRHLSILLTGDAEAEATGFDPPAVDVVKLAHHGSADAGLGGQLDLAAPDLAVVSLGENPHGHPAPETLAEVREREIPLARTDRGEVAITATPGEWRLHRSPG